MELIGLNLKTLARIKLFAPRENFGKNLLTFARSVVMDARIAQMLQIAIIVKAIDSNYLHLRVVKMSVTLMELFGLETTAKAK